MNFASKIKKIFNIFGNDDLHKKDRFDNKINNTHIDSDAILSLTSACVDLENNLDIHSTGKCGICVKDVNTTSFENMKKHVSDFLQIVSNEKNNKNLSFSYNSLLDDYNYLWFVLNGKKIEDIIVGINAIGDAIHEKGFSRQLLAAVFAFTTGYENLDGKSKYRINSSDSNIAKTQYPYL